MTKVTQHELDFGNAPGEVKGPDPKVWGKDEDRPSGDPNAIDPASLQAWAEGKPNKEGVKGPDPKVWS